METTAQKAQLDKEERGHLEDVVKNLRERAEQTVEYWIDAKLNLGSEDADPPANLSEREKKLRAKVKTAIEREQAGERSWAKARDLYVKGVGYTLVNRLAALRCMEVRGFLERSPTRFRGDGDSAVTPAADRLIKEAFMKREEALWTAFLVACHERSEEIEILFDLSDPYSLLYGDVAQWDGEPTNVSSWSDDLQSSLVGLLQDLSGLLDEVDDEVWRADDVLGWVYEYYNAPDLDTVRKKARGKGLEPEDVPVANQFYTPHWVVRMLTDNSLGKLFLEHEGALQETIQNQDKHFTPEERKARDADAAESVEDLCTYLVATEEEGEATNFEHPSDIRVFDPACGSGHFLLYAFDVLERIWWAMEPDIPRKKIPAKILKHNLYGIDLDLRACQLAAFNLYLKARSRTEGHGAKYFEMPTVGIVCADAHVADLDRSHRVIDEVAAGQEELRQALGDILTAFGQVEGLGSLLDVKGTLAELVDDADGQLGIFDDAGPLTLPELLDRLHGTVSERSNGSSFRAKDLRSFLRLLVILSQNYDVALMNPPYGSRTKMPPKVRDYVKRHYEYVTDYFVNFFELAERLSKKNGRIGLLIPHQFMFNSSFSNFRGDFLGERGYFEFLSELGYGILDNATVGTLCTVVRVKGKFRQKEGKFIDLSDVAKGHKEEVYVKKVLGRGKDGKIRSYTRDIDNFRIIDSKPLTYWIPENIRKIYNSEKLIDAEQAGHPERKSVGQTVTGVKTGKNYRFLRNFWEIHKPVENWMPYPKGGRDTWMLPRIKLVVNWVGSGKEMKRYRGPTQGIDNEYSKRGITFNIEKRSGKRFGIMHECSVFSHGGPALISDCSEYPLIGYLNSRFVTYLMLAQTSERRWNVGMVSKIPWSEGIYKTDIGGISKKITSCIYSLRKSDFCSPHFQGPLLHRLLPAYTKPGQAHTSHPHRDLSDELSIPEPPTKSRDTSLHELGLFAERFRQSVQQDIKVHEEELDRIVFNHFDVNEEQRKEIYAEIAHRTIDDPRETPSYDPDAVEEPPSDFPELVKRLLLHLAFEIVEEDDDGIVLLRAESDEEEADLLANMIGKFEEIWGEYAEDRLQEVDEVLGDRDPTDEPYPNLRRWLENDLFAFHCDEFENTPILWKLTTERLGEDDNEDAGFACLIDYHQLGPDVFDRLSARYLETRKAALQDRLRSARSMADSAEGEQARSARQEQQRCKRALRQIDALETKISELTQPTPRDWAESVRDDARDLKPKVRRFRKRLEERLETLDALHEEAPSSWFKDHFSDKFMESVNDNREEWVNALEDLEAACEQFARPADEPVEAHLYDLLPYFDDLVGSTHYSSNGIFFLNYYFSKGKDLAAKIDQGNKDRVTRREQLVADLARETDEDIELGEEIKEACQDMKKHMDSEWKTRALEEVRTPGYLPVKKHGVAINITPLAEKKLVPELVEEKVL